MRQQNVLRTLLSVIVALLANSWSFSQDLQQNKNESNFKTLSQQSFSIKGGSTDPKDCHGQYESELSIVPKYQFTEGLGLHVVLDVQNNERVYTPPTCTNGFDGVLDGVDARIDGTSNDAKKAMENPTGYIKEVRAVFDSGKVTLSGSGDEFTCLIPQGSKKFQTLEVDWAWSENKKTFTWQVEAGLPWFIRAMVAVAIGGAGFKFRKQLKNILNRPLGEDDKIIQGEGTKTPGNDAP